MIAQVGNILINQVKDLPFVDKYTGVVKVLTYNEKKGNTRIIKTFPASCTTTATECQNYSRYLDFCPDSSKKSVMYLEDTGLRLVSRDGFKLNFVANFDLVCWLNMPKLGFSDCSYSGIAIAGILKVLPIKPQNVGDYHLVNTQFVSQKPKSVNPFAKYSYDETVNQFLMFPYDYFVLSLQTSFQIDLRCIDITQIGAEIPCLNK